jgi:ubiquinone/menaquinone biosynthesis C-methylase UbiE
VLFGPLRCPSCQADFPVSEGIPDLAGEQSPAGAVQKGLQSQWVARSYERYVRPVAQLLLERKRLDRDSEFFLYRSLLGSPEGPVLDLACGTALLSRRLAREPNLPPLVGLDVSNAMLAEAMTQAREASVRIDFVRAAAPELPFIDASLGAVLQVGSLAQFAELETLFAEVGRVLRPGGRYVASSYLPPGRAASALHRKAGLHPHRPERIAELVAEAGLVKLERLQLPPLWVFKAEKRAQP